MPGFAAQIASALPSSPPRYVIIGDVEYECRKLGNGGFSLKKCEEGATTYTTTGNSCTCPHHTRRGADCKHMQKVREMETEDASSE